MLGIYSRNESPHQFGFIPRHSTVNQVQQITESVVSGLERKEHSTVEFLDVDQANEYIHLCIHSPCLRLSVELWATVQT